MKKPRRPWSSDDLATLVRMREVERCRWSDIDRTLNRSDGGACGKYASLRREELPRHPAEAGGRVEVSTAQEIDRSARKQAAMRRDLTGEVFGDPPPGYSALDKRSEATS